MAGNPLIAQGSISRVRASITWPGNASLNVTAAFLARDGIRLALDGDSTLFIPTMTGAVTSPEPYMMITCTINLLKSQQIGGIYKAQMENNALIGDGTVRPDSAELPPYQILNCAIQSVRELAFTGTDATFAVVVRGFYLINSSMWN